MRGRVGAALLGPLGQPGAHAPGAGLERLRERVVEQHLLAGRAAKLGDAGAHRAGADDAEDHLPLNSGLRFSTNAVMPSTRSSVAIASS